ncbi:MAG: MYXO-CTERM sorting domain-containing protein, partial [Polyangiales bacterium]
VISIDPNKIARDSSGRINYPMVLARAVDEAGGDGFAVEYRGNSPRTTFGNNSCCSAGGDFCGLSHNNKCECPGSEVDAADCAAQGDLVDGVKLVDDLAEKYSVMTRITTRVSPEEMRFDPTYERDTSSSALPGKLTVRGKQPSLEACESRIIDKERYAEVEATSECSTLYCGAGGQCATTAAGAACQCAPGTVAQRFGDLDGTASVTCVPTTPTVDLRAGGLVLPDACAGVSCGNGSCIDRNGVAVCECAPGSAARAGTGSAPRCETIVTATHTAGAMDYTEPLRGLEVCAPPPPSCGPDGWLVKTGSTNPGVNCGSTEPAYGKTVPGPKPTCDDWFGGCVGCQSGGGGAIPMVGIAWVVGALLFRRRRKAPRQ